MGWIISISAWVDLKRIKPLDGQVPIQEAGSITGCVSATDFMDAIRGLERRISSTASYFAASSLFERVQKN